MTLAIDRITPQILVSGAAIPPAWLAALIGLRVNRGLCVVSRAQIRFSDPGYQLSAANKFSLGTQVGIKLYSGEALFNGIVTGSALEQVSGAHPELVVTVDDLACKLAIGTKVLTHENKNLDGLVRDLAQGAGLQVSGTLDAAGGSVQEYLLQSGSDLDMLDTVIRRANAVWWVNDSTLNIVGAGAWTGTVQINLGENLLDFSVRASGLRPTEVSVAGWDPTAQQGISGTNNTSPNTAKSDFVTSYIGKAPSLSSNTLSVSDGNPNVAAEAASLANALNADWEAGAVIARGTSIVDPRLGPAVTVRVGQAGPASGTYVISEVEHVLRSDGFYTRFVAGPLRPIGLVDTLGNQPPDPGYEMAGLMTAVVSDTKDPKNWGRVKVKYSNAAGNLVSNWARVMSLGGGNSRGTVFQPEAKDEVLVGFEHGDSRRPVVLGGLFSANVAVAADASVRGSDGKTMYRRITSRLGHYVELGDGTSPDTQHILLLLGNPAHKLRLGADKFEVEVTDGKPISIKAGSMAKFEIDGQGNISIEGASVSIKATQKDIALEATAGQASVKGQVGVSVEGLKIGVKADTQLDLEGQVQTAIKGGIVMIN